MPDDPNSEVKMPEQIAAEAAQAETERKARESAELARAISSGVVEGLAAREAAAKKETPAVQVQEPAIEQVDPNEFDRRIKAGEPVADLLTKFAGSIREETRRAALAETGGAAAGLQEINLSNAREKIAHFTEYEDEITKIVNRVSPARRTFKVYQDAAAMVLGRPEISEKIVQERIRAEVEKATTKPKDSMGDLGTAGASRVVKSAGVAHEEGELAPTEENLRRLVGDDAFQAFLDKKRQRGISLDGEAMQQGYPDAKAWFKRMRENDRRTLSGEGLGLDR